MRLEGEVEKTWGSELIWATNDLYCGKFLRFKEGHSFSMHMHREKDETWYVLSGKFELLTINTENSIRKREFLEEGDTKHIPPMLPHQLICLEAGTVIEVSTPDSVEDNYRIWKGHAHNAVHS